MSSQRARGVQSSRPPRCLEVFIIKAQANHRHDGGRPHRRSDGTARAGLAVGAPADVAAFRFDNEGRIHVECTCKAGQLVYRADANKEGTL